MRSRVFGWWATIVAVALGAVVLAAPLEAKTKPLPDRLLIQVHVRIRLDTGPNQAAQASEVAPRLVTFSPKVVNVGTYLLVVNNSDTERNRIEIAGVTSRNIGKDGGRAVMRVKFATPGIYAVALYRETPVQVTGSIKVIK